MEGLEQTGGCYEGEWQDGGDVSPEPCKVQAGCLQGYQLPLSVPQPPGGSGQVELGPTGVQYLPGPTSNWSNIYLVQLLPGTTSTWFNIYLVKHIPGPTPT